MTDLVFDFSGRVVAVTGAGNGIGRETALRFAGAGASVWLLDRDGAALDEASRQAAGSTEPIRSIVCDVTDPVAVRSAFDGIAAGAGRLDVLVNNAGGFWRQQGIEETSDEDWSAVLDLNLTGVFSCSRAAIPLLRRSARGRIINIGSLAGLTTLYRSTPSYTAAKAAVHALTRVLAYELGPDAITANAVAPSAVMTDRIAVVRSAEERERTRRTIPLGRYGTPEDIAAVVMFLATDEASYVTGQTISVNGGRFMV